MHVLRDNGKVQGKGNLKEKREKKKWIGRKQFTANIDRIKSKE